MLTGTGRVGSLQVDGTLAPGNLWGGGTLSVAGDVALNAGSTFGVMADEIGTLSRLVADGNVHIDGALMRVTAAGVDFQEGTLYQVILADGGVTGGFSDLETDLVFFTPEIQQEVGAVALVMKRNATAIEDLLKNPNARAAAAAVDALAGDNPLKLAVLNSDRAGVTAAFAVLPGDIHPGVRTVLTLHTQEIGQATRGRFGTLAEASLLAPGEQCGAATVSERALPDNTGSGRVLYHCGDGVISAWGGAFGSESRLKAAPSGASALRSSTSGFIAGVDTTVANSWRLGVAGSYSSGSIHSALPAAAQHNSWTGILYGALALNDVYIGGGYAHSVHGIKTGRDISIRSLNEHLTSQYRGHSDQIFGEASYSHVLNSTVAVSPFAGFTYNATRTAAFDETGGGSALQAQSSEQKTISSLIGVRGKADILVDESSILSLKGSMGWNINIAGRGAENSARFKDGTETFRTRGVELPRNSLMIEAGMGLALDDGVTLDVNYIGSWSGADRSNAIRGSLTTKF